MAINLSVHYNDGFLSYIILLTVDPVLLPSGNPIICHKEVSIFASSLQPSFDNFPPWLGDAQKV